MRVMGLPLQQSMQPLAEELEDFLEAAGVLRDDRPTLLNERLVALAGLRGCSRRNLIIGALVVPVAPNGVGSVPAGQTFAVVALRGVGAHAKTGDQRTLLQQPP